MSVQAPRVEREPTLAALRAAAGTAIERERGAWLLPHPEAPTDPTIRLGVRIDGSGVAALDRWVLPDLRRLHKVGLTTLPWLLRRAAADPKGEARFRWSELGRLFGRPAPAGNLIDGYRRAVEELAAPEIERRSLDLRAPEGSPAARPHIRHVPLVDVIAFHASGDGPSGREATPNRVRAGAEWSPYVAGGAFSGIDPEDLVAAPSDLLRRLWLLASAWTLLPPSRLDAAGGFTVALESERLATMLSADASTPRRVRRVLARSLGELVERDPRFSGSRLEGEVLVLMRRLPLVAGPNG